MNTLSCATVYALIYPNRRLRAVWSLEAQQDLMSVHNIPDLSELATQIRDEIEREFHDPERMASQ